jgi:hypothetical protein
MKMRWCWGVLLLGVVGLCGCQGTVEEQPVEDTTTRLGDSIDVKLSDWLELPRKELAEMTKEALDRFENTLKETRTSTGVDSVALLSTLRMPLTVPVLGQANYSSKAGFSLPPYFKEGTYDPDLALHLALHGDVDAALKLVDPDNAALVEKLQAFRTSRNYPVEWTRLVALALQEAELKMAKGEIEGATELVLVHRQLRELLDKKAAAGQLGAVLLPLGQRALRDAVTAWRESDNKFPAVAEEVEATLKEWGEMPVWEPGLTPGAAHELVSRFFSSKNPGQILAVSQALPLQRLLDLQNLPLVSEGITGALALFDDKDQLGELWYVYRFHIGETFPEALHLAHHLAELGLKGKPAEKVDGLQRQTFSAGKLAYEYTLVPRSRVLGAVLRVANEGVKPLGGRLPRQPFVLGGLNLERTFENTRFQLAPREVSGKSVEVKQPEALAQVKLPFGEPQPAVIELDRAGDTNLIAAMTARWATDENMTERGLEKLCLPLWLAYGASRLESGDHHLILTWEQSPAKVSLKFPYEPGVSPDFIVQDMRGSKQTEERLKAAVVLDEQARLARWEANKPLERLPRFLGWPELSLGTPREQASKNLPPELKSRAPIKTADGSFSILFTSTAPATATYFPLQLVLRFGPDDKLAEVRVRYQEGPTKPTAAAPSLLEVLKKSSGAPEPVVPAPWLGLWGDMPALKTVPMCWRWQDDRSMLTYQADGVCTEVTLTDCPREYPMGVPLKKWETLVPGLPGCQLGDSREELIKRWKIEKPTTISDGGLVVYQPATSQFDLAVVYFDKGKANRILARQRTPPTSSNEDFTTDLNRLWVSDLDRLGVVCRVDKALHTDTREPVVCGYSWHDDRTRVHCFGGQTKDGWRMFREWRDWPFTAPPKDVASKR